MCTNTMPTIRQYLYVARVREVQLHARSQPLTRCRVFKYSARICLLGGTYSLETNRPIDLGSLSAIREEARRSKTR